MTGLAALRALAEQATPGPWEARRPDHRGGLCTIWGTEWAIPWVGEVTGGNAAYIAALSPDVVLSLIDAAERAERLEAALHEGYIHVVPHDGFLMPHDSTPDWLADGVTAPEGFRCEAITAKEVQCPKWAMVVLAGHFTEPMIQASIHLCGGHFGVHRSGKTVMLV